LQSSNKVLLKEKQKIGSSKEKSVGPIRWDSNANLCFKGKQQEKLGSLCSWPGMIDRFEWQGL
jgi:hypothetical protein